VPNALADKEFGMKLSIVLSTHTTSFDALAYSGDFARNVQRIAELGYDGVELAVRDPALVDADAVAEIVADARLEVPAIGTGQAYVEEGLSFTSPDPRIRARAIARIENQADFAARFGAQVVIGLIRGRLVEGVSREQAMQWLVVSLRECADYAVQREVRLNFEPLSRLDTDLVHTVDEALSLLEEVGAPNLGLLLDTFHMNIEEPSIYGSLVRAGAHITHFHLSDSNRQYPGAGHVDFAGIVAMLRALEYEDYLSAEVLPLPDPDTCAARAIAYMRPLLAGL
jgi:sugar phosphate isomerase/epimerase